MNTIVGQSKTWSAQKNWEEINKRSFEWIDKYFLALVGAKALEVSDAGVEKIF